MGVVLFVLFFSYLGVCLWTSTIALEVYLKRDEQGIDGSFHLIVGECIRIPIGLSRKQKKTKKPSPAKERLNRAWKREITHLLKQAVLGKNPVLRIVIGEDQGKPRHRGCGQDGPASFSPFQCRPRLSCTFFPGYGASTPNFHSAKLQ